MCECVHYIVCYAHVDNFHSDNCSHQRHQAQWWQWQLKLTFTIHEIIWYLIGQEGTECGQCYFKFKCNLPESSSCFDFSSELKTYIYSFPYLVAKCLQSYWMYIRKVVIYSCDKLLPKRNHIRLLRNQYFFWETFAKIGFGEMCLSVRTKIDILHRNVFCLYLTIIGSIVLGFINLFLMNYKFSQRKRANIT